MAHAWTIHAITNVYTGYWCMLACNRATPNLGEIHEYLRDGILLECVAAYRQHVLACVPASDSSASDHPPDASLPPPSSPSELSSPQITSQRPLYPPAAPLALSPKHSGPSEAKAQRQTECRPQSIVHPQPASPYVPPGVLTPALPGPYALISRPGWGRPNSQRPCVGACP
ncbi:hypothetical protein B5X24_HaOG211861 [Helicoverpa armigera]|nr:hypothetical protein B5X24_HaOG211861 [Helicoverpa armigera]